MDLALGTVQFGLAYGAVGSGVQVDDATAVSILDDAWQHGLRWLDTAAAYGDIEQRLAGLCGSKRFRIASKIRPLATAGDAGARAALMTGSVTQSLERLGDRLRVLMFHSAADLLADDGESLWAQARKLVQGRDIRLGVSCYSPIELLRLRERLDIEFAQLPANAFDQRLLQTLHDPAGRTRLDGVVIHVRSVFLQGLLLAPGRGATRVPAAAAALQRWQARCDQADLEPTVAALGAVQPLPGVQACVVGVESLAQWQGIRQAWSRTRPLEWPDLACADPQVYDPRMWPKQ